MNSWLARHAASIMPVVPTPDITLAHGRGALVYDTAGKEYVDLLAGIAVNVLGHAHPAIVEAVSTQVATLGHVSNFFATRPQILLAERLLDICQAPEGSRVFFSNSGAEANEAAFKIARRTGKQKVIAVAGGFHGRTMGALAMTEKAAYREPFAPGVPGVVHVPFGDIQALEAEIDTDTAAVIIEPLQGEAGVRKHPAGYLAAARRRTQAVGALLILDEIQTGIGRTGSWLAYQDESLGEGITPDCVTLAKGLGGGLPLAATITYGDAVSSLLHPGQHGSTFSGNPIAAAAGGAVIDTVEAEGLCETARTTGEWLARQLRSLLGESAVDGAGLLLSVRVGDVAPAKTLTSACLDRGYIVNPVTPERLRLATPLIIEQSSVENFVHTLAELVVNPPSSHEWMPRHRLPSHQTRDSSTTVVEGTS